jgi:hypothetical protein
MATQATVIAQATVPLAKLDKQVEKQFEEMARSLRTLDYAPRHLQNEEGEKRYKAARAVMQEATSKTQLGQGVYNTLSTGAGVAGCVAFIAGLVLLASSGQTWKPFACTLFLTILLGLAATWVGHWLECKRTRAIGNATSLAVALPLLSHQTEADKGYALAVAEVAQSAYLPAPTRDTLLDGLRSLLELSRTLNAKQAEIRRAMCNETPRMLQAQISHLSQRLQTATDEATRDALTQSLALCQARYARVEHLHPQYERLQAQSEWVLHTFVSVQATVAGFALLQNAPVSECNLAHLHETADEITRQTHSVEQAVREVLEGESKQD